jgi:hypothetical protein
VPATSWLSVGTPAAPIVSVRNEASSGRPLLEIAPTPKPPVPIGLGGTSTVSTTPWLWVVQTRTDAGWTTEVVPAAVRTRPLSARGVGTPREVRVTTIDRLGVASEAAVITPPF